MLQTLHVVNRASRKASSLPGHITEYRARADVIGIKAAAAQMRQRGYSLAQALRILVSR